MKDVDKLITENLKLATWKVKQFNGGIFDEDLFQIACIGLIKAARSFDETKGFKFSTYAAKSMHFTLLHNTRELNKSVKSDLSLDQFVNEDKGFTIADILPSSIDVADESVANADYEKAYKKFSKREKKVIEFRMQGMNQKAIAEKIGVTQTSVSRILNRIKLRLI